mmetsp:Transcript_7010/g.14595  ORF Transcript_7010/g.14595 Transcript_7010/m.14595 type:complete len:335 (-) Transcript_7010:99-1103(-)
MQPTRPSIVAVAVATIGGDRPQQLLDARLRPAPVRRFHFLRGRGRRTEVELPVPHDKLHAVSVLVQFGHLPQLLDGERPLSVAPPSGHGHRSDAASQHVPGGGRHVRPRQPASALGQDAGAVQGHVAVAHHHRVRAPRPVAQRPRDRGRPDVLRMSVVPSDEAPRRHDAVQPLPVDAERAVRVRRPGRQHHGGVQVRQVGEGDVAPHPHVAEVGRGAVRVVFRVGVHHASELFFHVLRILVVGCDAVADQAEGMGEAFDDVHFDAWSGGAEFLWREGLQDIFRRVEAARTRADDCHTKRILGRRRRGGGGGRRQQARERVGREREGTPWRERTA